MKLPAIAAACLLCTSFSHANTVHNYVEMGLGASQLFSFNSKTNDALNEYSVAPSFKVSTGSRLNHTRTLWFELGYSHNGTMEHEQTKLSTQSVFSGLKISSDPIENTSMFMRGGIGKIWSETKTTGEARDTGQSNHYYGGAGFNFRLDQKKSVVIELQHLNDSSSDQAINGVFLSLNQFI